MKAMRCPRMLRRWRSQSWAIEVHNRNYGAAAWNTQDFSGNSSTLAGGTVFEPTNTFCSLMRKRDGGKNIATGGTQMPFLPLPRLIGQWSSFIKSFLIHLFKPNGASFR